MHEFLVRGVVQGVGFRPFIYNECVKAGLVGYVQNIGSGVVVVVNDKEQFINILSHPPPLARIDFVGYKEHKQTYSYSDFTIRDSLQSKGFSQVPPDLYVCPDCQEELTNTSDWRHDYWFISCTNCGPRFSMIHALPYDRPYTSMKHFPMCRKCRLEYTNPSDRRYHAQTIACPDCGPSLELITKEGELVGGVEQAADLLRAGEILAVKGVGGFHLVCTIDSCSSLRELVGRPDQPFAIMVKDLTMARTLVHINHEEEQLLTSTIRPIVLLNKQDPQSHHDVSELDSLGIMLPYTALHYLLFNHLDQPLIFTSSNKPGMPITTTLEEQFAPYTLTHNREIIHPLDDSIAKVINGKTVWIRKSRGLVPNSIPLATKKNILSFGAEMNSSFCLVTDGRAIVSQYFGDLSHLEVQERFLSELESYQTLFSFTPELLVCDAHPDYSSSLLAHQLSVQHTIPLLRVQHHRAHAAAVAQEHQLQDYASIIMDGLGYGDDSSVWGGEVFHNDERIGHLQEHVLLGGDSSTKRPSLMLCSVLLSFLDSSLVAPIIRGVISRLEFDLLVKEYEERLNSPLTTSAGRIIDAAAALLLGSCERTYDGRAAMLLESLASTASPYELEPLITKQDKRSILDTTHLFKFLVNNLHKDNSRLAATVFHYLAQGLHVIAEELNKPIVFSGGVAANKHITSYFLSKKVFLPKDLPVGDGGVCFGQAVIAMNKERHTSQSNSQKYARRNKEI